MTPPSPVSQGVRVYPTARAIFEPCRRVSEFGSAYFNSPGRPGHQAPPRKFRGPVVPGFRSQSQSRLRTRLRAKRDVVPRLQRDKHRMHMDGFISIQLEQHLANGRVDGEWGPLKKRETMIPIPGD